MEPPAKRPRLNSALPVPGVQQRTTHLETISGGFGTAFMVGDDEQPTQLMSSPFRLNRVHGLPADDNKDTITLHDILGDPLIKECWQFNFIHDIGFLMAHFDHDVRHLVDVHIVHGFWKKGDLNRKLLETEAAAYKNVNIHTAPMPRSPGSFGVHHAKLMILLRHDNTAQIVIHTANITSLDWYGTRNAIWCSPLLPRLGQCPQHSQASTDPAAAIGHTFKKDLIEYLRAYNARSRAIGTLPGRLGGYDFSAVRAALVASVPGRYPAGGAQSDRWGWPGLRRLLSTVPAAPGASDVVAQVSAVATLGSTDEWLSRCLRPALATTAPDQEDVPGASEPNLKILFPTAEDVRRSAGGYSAGAGVLTSISTPQQIKQLAYLRPFLCRQGRGVPRSACGTQASAHSRIAGQPTAPARHPVCHAKTYIRHAQGGIDWALLTSANISKQAWGSGPSKTRGEMTIASWELGVLIWPSMFGQDVQMVATTVGDLPTQSTIRNPAVLVGVRTPYTTPLRSYQADEIPWVVSMQHNEPDCLGQTWAGLGRG
ncbi:tyrosyl-DNA phosphodiesterase [Colletotrichum limetticola]|uniref:Tyrosyl-DNA phosphodiesterase n=1 Tax=Colletotrichum limetticola TaxID=1209924 RepID=A0ABQ9P7W2_9PEZI|nr:tyrosyl-DNA phosphodiesterase [Colletotrichum limetticola]